MANAITHPTFESATTHRYEREAYHILHAGFVAAPIIAGLDKFTEVLTNWDQYLAPQFANMFGASAHTFMLVVGVIEIAAGLLVAVKPRIGAYVVAGWLGAIIVNLLLTGHYFDIALRDFGLALGALALARLSHVHDRRAITVERSRAAAL